MRLRLIVLCMALALLSAFAGEAPAQPHEKAAGGYVLRASVISAAALPAAQARAHGIPATPNVGVLNVTVMPEGDTRPVKAAVRASRETLAGTTAPIEMRPATAEGFVSYFGTFEIAGRGLEQRFRVSAKPAGASTWIDLSFADQVAIRGTP